jgi:dolichol-phosphate mannosyltransferase
MSLAFVNPRGILFDDSCAHETLLGGRERLALVIPTVREAGNIRILLDRTSEALEQTGSDYEIIIVDDDSCDGTAEIVTAIAENDPRVRLIVRKGHKGLAGAVLHGWRHTDATILGAMDADLQHPPELLPELASAIFSGCDLAIGSRYAARDCRGQENPVRGLLSAAAIWAAAPIQRAERRARDPMSGYFLVRRECLDGIAFQPEGFKLLLEILVRGRIRSIKEIPFAFGRRSCGTSKANAKVACDYARLLARLYCEKFALQRARTIVSPGRQEAD